MHRARQNEPNVFIHLCFPTTHSYRRLEYQHNVIISRRYDRLSITLHKTHNTSTLASSTPSPSHPQAHSSQSAVPRAKSASSAFRASPSPHPRQHQHHQAEAARRTKLAAESKQQPRAVHHQQARQDRFSRVCKLEATTSNAFPSPLRRSHSWLPATSTAPSHFSTPHIALLCAGG